MTGVQTCALPISLARFAKSEQRQLATQLGFYPVIVLWGLSRDCCKLIEIHLDLLWSVFSLGELFSVSNGSIFSCVSLHWVASLGGSIQSILKMFLKFEI